MPQDYSNVKWKIYTSILFVGMETKNSFLGMEEDGNKIGENKTVQ